MPNFQKSYPSIRREISTQVIKMMSNELRGTLERFPWRSYFKTRIVCAWNELPLTVGLRPALFIVNTMHSHEKGIGHWICLLFPIFTKQNNLLFESHHLTDSLIRMARLKHNKSPSAYEHSSANAGLLHALLASDKFH